jgi:hypothetical protein
LEISNLAMAKVEKLNTADTFLRVRQRVYPETGPAVYSGALFTFRQIFKNVFACF